MRLASLASLGVHASACLLLPLPCAVCRQDCVQPLRAMEMQEAQLGERQPLSQAMMQQQRQLRLARH